MEVLRTTYAQSTVVGSVEYDEVCRISDQLLEHLNTVEAIQAILVANQPGMSSSYVQATFEPFATDLGFKNEAKGLFLEYENKALLPDYCLPIPGNGIILEVERGKTTTNNMDLLDLWKCHVCSHADYRFLMVPQALQHNPKMTPKKEYNSVVKRMGSFFLEGNFTNVRALHIFGY